MPDAHLKQLKKIEALAKLKIENKKKALQVYEESKKNAFSVALKNPQKKLEKLRQEFQKSEQELFEKKKPVTYRKVPETIRKSVSIKLTTAAILREDELVRKQREKEEKWIQDVQLGLKDEEEFEKWRKELQIKGIYNNHSFYRAGRKTIGIRKEKN